jgi:C-terminal processing protease CtpA/Prc
MKTNALNGRARAHALSLRPILSAFFALALFGAGVGVARAQSFSANDRDNGLQMLRTMKDDLKKYYYDPSVRGIDLDARFKAAEDRIKQSKSNGEVMGVIAQLMLELNDSHTSFVPPRRSARIEYGWQMKRVGEDCYVSAVKPGGDADAQGLKVGDKIVSLDGRPLQRDNVWLAKYLYYALRPQPGMRLVVEKPDGARKQLDVRAKVTERKKILNFSGDDNGEDIFNEMRDEQDEDRLHRHRYYELGDDAVIWKMPQFDLDEGQAGAAVGKFRSKRALILDLRGNPGGYVKTLEWLAGYFFDHDLKIADLKGRKEMKPQLAKTRGGGGFKGQLVVLVDAESSSAAEIFARLVQLEKRGTVLGDRSSGMVMQSRYYDHQIGIDKVIYYGASVTNADLVMSDGKSLEHVGVTPDELLLPTAADMASGRDPVLARAAAIVGAKLDAEKAGALFPTEWRGGN